jgi:archaellin
MHRNISHVSPVLFGIGIIMLAITAGCTTVPGFSGIYVSEDNPYAYLEFRPGGSVYSTIDGTPQEVARWTQPSKGQIIYCGKGAEECLDIGVDENSIYYYKAGRKISMIQADKIPEQPPAPVKTQAVTQAVTTPAYDMNNDVQLLGQVYGLSASSRPASLDYIQFTLGAAPGGNAVDLSQVAVSYSDGSTDWPAYSYIPGTSVAGTSVARSARWGISKISGSPSGSTVLSPGGEYTIVLGLPSTTTANRKFIVTLKMPDSSEFRISRTVPATLQQVNVLY